MGVGRKEREEGGKGEKHEMRAGRESGGGRGGQRRRERRKKRREEKRRGEG